MRPLRHPKLYHQDFNVRDIAEVWRRGRIIAAWLLDLTAEALQRVPELGNFTGRVGALARMTAGKHAARWVGDASACRVR